MKVFISGGCKNGKSFYAQHIAKAQAENSVKTPDLLYYVATMKPVDAEDDERIVRHIKERDGWGFTTVEQHCGIDGILEKCNTDASFLLDSVTALLANEMFPGGSEVNENAAEKIIHELLHVLGKVENIVIVSDYIYSDAMQFDPLTEKYRQSLASIDRAAARCCDTVLEIAYTNVIVHKGGIDGITGINQVHLAEWK